MTDFGVTPTGFNRKLLTDILSSIQDRHRSTFGAGIDVAIAAELGQVDGNFASELAEVWEIIETAFNGFNPEDATDYLLTVLASLTGTERRAAVASTFPIAHPLTINLNAGVTVNAGSLVSVLGRPDIVFSLDTTTTNLGGSAANFSVAATCTQTGPIAAIAASVTVIGTPVSGWNSVTNASDAVIGRNADDDIQLRQRRVDELALRGGSTVGAIKADLLDFANHPELIGVNAVSILENVGDSTDVNGLPGHSFEAIIDDFAQDGVTHQVADPNSIAQAIWDGKPAGIRTAGGSSATATDANGDTHTVNFSYVTAKPVYMIFTLTKTVEYPVDGDAQLKLAVVTKGATLLANDDVIALAFRAIALTIAGVVDVTAFTLGFAPVPVGTANLAVGVRERATFSSLNITVM